MADRRARLRRLNPRGARDCAHRGTHPAGHHRAHGRRPDHRPRHAGLPAADRASRSSWASRRGRNTYRLHDALASIGLGMLSQVIGVFTKLLRSACTCASSTHVALWHCRRDGSPGSGWRRRCCSTTCATTGCIASGTLRAALGGARGAPPERGLQPVHRAAPDRLGLARADGCSTCRWPSPACRRWSSRVVALIDLLYQYWVHTRADRPARLVRPLVLRAVATIACTTPSNDALPRSQLRRRADRLGPPVRQLPGGARRTLRLRHAQPAAQLESAVGQPRGLCRPAARQPACAALERQAARLVQAAGLAAGRRRGALSEGRRSRSPRSPRYEPAVSRRASAPPRRLSSRLAADLVFLWNTHRLATLQSPAPRPSSPACGWSAASAKAGVRRLRAIPQRAFPRIGPIGGDKRRRAGETRPFHALNEIQPIERSKKKQVTAPPSRPADHPADPMELALHSAGGPPRSPPRAAGKPAAPAMVPAVKRALGLLEQLARRSRADEPGAAGERAGRCPRAACTACAATLVSLGYLRRQPDGAFLIGPRVMGLAEAFVAGTNVAHEFDALWDQAAARPRRPSSSRCSTGAEVVYVAGAQRCAPARPRLQRRHAAAGAPGGQRQGHARLPGRRGGAPARRRRRSAAPHRPRIGRASPSCAGSWRRRESAATPSTTRACAKACTARRAGVRRLGPGGGRHRRVHPQGPARRRPRRAPSAQLLEAAQRLSQRLGWDLPSAGGPTAARPRGSGASR